MDKATILLKLEILRLEHGNHEITWSEEDSLETLTKVYEDLIKQIVTAQKLANLKPKIRFLLLYFGGLINRSHNHKNIVNQINLIAAEVAIVDNLEELKQMVYFITLKIRKFPSLVAHFDEVSKQIFIELAD